jgi:hypothetical protein
MSGIFPVGEYGIFSWHKQEGSQLARFRLSQFVRARLIVGTSVLRLSDAVRRCVGRIWIIEAGTYKITTDPWITI